MRRTLAAALLVAAFIPARAQALENEELLALVAMPLAVAAVSEMTDVPMNDLIDVVTLMNDADVAPAQFVEVVRYAPVALVVELEQPEPRFAEFVRVQYDSGLRGPVLVNAIEERFQHYGVNGVDLDVTAPRLVDVDDRFIPAIVRTRLAERSRLVEGRSHPHGGPPGQLKKQVGVQTGAEIVHGTKPGRKHDRADDRVVTRVIDRGEDRVIVDRKVTKHAAGHDRGHEGGGKAKGKGKGKGGKG